MLLTVVYTVLYTLLYAVLYTVMYTVLYTALYTVLHAVLYTVLGSRAIRVGRARSRWVAPGPGSSRVVDRGSGKFARGGFINIYID